MKKLLFGVLAFMLVLGLATVTAGGGQEKGAAPAAPVELILWGTGNLNPPEGTRKADAAIYRTLDKFEADNPGIKVELIIQPAENLLELFRAANAAKSGPDVVRLFGGSVNEFIPALLPLNKYFTDAELKGYNGLEFARQDYAISGPIYAVPADSYVCLPYYNKAVWAKSGMGTSDIPTDWDQLLNLCEKFKNQGVIAMFMGVKDGYQPSFIISHLLANLVGPDGVGWLKKQKTLIGSELDKSLKILQEFTEKGYINKDSLSISLGEIPGRFFQSSAAIMYHGNWELQNAKVILGDNLGMFKMPPYDATGPFKDYHYAGTGSNTAIPNYTKHPDQAAKLLRVMIGDDFQAAMMNQKGLMPNNRNFNVNLVNDPIGRQIISVANAGPGATIREILPPKMNEEIYRLVGLLTAGRISAREMTESIDKVLKEVRAE